VVSEDFSLELLRGLAVTARGADRRGGLNGRPAVPAFVAAAVAANKLIDILQVAPLLAAAVGRFAVSVGPAKFVHKDLAVALAEAILDGEPRRGSNPNLLGLTDSPGRHNGSDQI